MRLIDADTLIGAIRHDVEQTPDSDLGYGLNHAIPIVRSQPTVDAVMVVRCKDCKNFSFKEHWADIGHGAKILCADHCPTCDKWADGCKTDPEGFCFLAERAVT